MINGHGDDLYKYPDIIANFSSNVYQDTKNEELIQHLQNILPSSLGAYPEPEPYELQHMLAKHHNVAPESILVTNGATEAIYLIAHLFSGKSVNIIEPTFSEYRSASLLYNSPITQDSSILWLCNPNNPTGQILSENYPRASTLIIDRSYEYYSTIDLPPISIDNKHIYIYSLTKRYKIPGLRIGYIIASPTTIEKLRNLRQPWSVNSLAIEAGKWIVKHNFPETINRTNLWNECDNLQRQLKQISGMIVETSATHFFLIKTPILAKDLKEQLAREYGILIRDASNFKGLTPFHIRIATQTAEVNQLLIQALTDKLSPRT